MFSVDIYQLEPIVLIHNIQTTNVGFYRGGFYVVAETPEIVVMMLFIHIKIHTQENKHTMSHISWSVGGRQFCVWNRHVVSHWPAISLFTSWGSLVKVYSRFFNRYRSFHSIFSAGNDRPQSEGAGFTLLSHWPSLYMNIACACLHCLPWFACVLKGVSLQLKVVSFEIL